MNPQFDKKIIKSHKPSFNNKEILKKRIIEKKIKDKINTESVRSFLFLHIFWILGLIFLASIAAIYFVYLSDLPSIKKLGDNILPESSIIYDKNGGELYKLYTDEKRTYVDYGMISQKMKDAITSTEDKTFFENKGFDFKGLVRAGLNYVIGKSDKIQGTSTISQQLIKVSFLTSERSIKRKIQEIYLSYKLNSAYSKEKILEMYLNKIPFGSNAFGVEEASKTFFGKSSKDIGILESSILASIPKGPTYYSPYSHNDRLMGYIFAYINDNSKEQIKIADTDNPAFYNPLKDKLKAIIQDFEMKKIDGNTVEVCNIPKDFIKKDFKIDNNSCAKIDYSALLNLLNSIKINYSDLKLENRNENLENFTLEYNTGRKDFVLERMLEDNKINFDEYKKALIDSLDFKFKRYSENIKYPYFVFYVKEYLEDNFGKDFSSLGGLKIYTTIDPKLQDKAEELVKKQVAINKTKYGANNAALVSVDNRNGNILSMVGGVDYFDESKGSNVNIITSLRQPGSSFKPIEYSYAIANKPISPETPVYDSETKFGSWEPDNYDTHFMGLMPLRKALDYSRNIPAIKVFLYGGGESAIIKFARSLGILSLKENAGYGAPLAIGTGELKPLELVTAYSVFANYGIKREVSPISKIEDTKGNLIYQKKLNDGKQVFSAAASYIISKILSDASSRPNSFWNNVLTLKDRAVAAKTGTSNKDVSKGKKKEILPGDLWTAGYTPQITTVVWAGNTDGSPTKGTCDGLNCAAPIWHDFMQFAHIGLEKKEFVEPDGVIHATISRASGKLVTNSTPSEYKVSSIFAVKPTEYDGGYKSIKVDSLCNGLVTDSTPPEAIKTIYLGGSNSPIIDSYDKIWLKSIGKYSNINGSGSGTTESDIKDTPCERPGSDSAGLSISSSLIDGSSLEAKKQSIDIRYDSNNPIISVLLYIGEELYKTYKVNEELGGNIEENIDFGPYSGNQKITIKIVDKFYYTKSKVYNIKIGGSGEDENSNNTSSGTQNIPATDSNSSQTIPTGVSPIISMKNPPEGDNTISVYADQFANIRGNISSATIDAINVYINGKLYKILDGANSFVFPINENKDMAPGNYSVKIEAFSSDGNSSSKIINLEVLAR